MLACGTLRRIRATRAITRGISDRFANAVVKVRSAASIDVPLARRQHAAYVVALRQIGIEVSELPPLAERPDACFVEDCAVHAEGVALVTRLGARSRRGEETEVGERLGQWVKLEHTSTPATVDGGDCLRVGGSLFVGRSRRTNAAGLARVTEVFTPLGLRVVEVTVDEALHLKCFCSALDDSRVLVAEGAIDLEIFRGLDVVTIPREEAYAANVVSVNGTVLVAAGFPKTRRILTAAGFRVVPLDVSEIRKADGSLTCLSILV